MASPLKSSKQLQVAPDPVSDSGRDPAELTPFERELIAIFVEMMQTLGFPKSYGEIYGLLYATPKPLGFADIHARLPISKGSVSGGLKALREIGAVNSVNGSSDRRERFEPQLELKKIVLAYMRVRLQPQLEDNAARMAQLSSHLDAAQVTAGDRKILRSRLGKLGKWRHKAADMVTWVARFFS